MDGRDSKSDISEISSSSSLGFSIWIVSEEVIFEISSFFRGAIKIEEGIRNGLFKFDKELQKKH